MTITEKVAYLKGLMEGMEIGEDTKEGKLFSKICEILTDLAEEVDDINADVAELNDRVDEIDEDLGELEDDVYSDDEDEDDEFDDEDEDDEDFCDGNCDECDGCGEEFYEVTCGDCGEKIEVTEEILLEGSMHCPKCDAELVFDVEYEDEEESED